MKFKKIICAVITGAMLFTAAFVPSYAYNREYCDPFNENSDTLVTDDMEVFYEKEGDINSLLYTVREDGTAMITGWAGKFYAEGAEFEFNIPSTINGHTVTAIADEALSDGYAKIVGVSVPSTVKVIGVHAIDARYRITVAGGIDSAGKQIRTRRTWEPPKPGMTEKQIEKSLSRAVADFEREIEQGYRLDHKQTFAEYAKYVLDLKERTGTKPRTIERYQSLLERVNKAIGHLKLTDIRPQHLNTFYQNLGEEGIRNGATKAVAHIDIRAWIKNNGTSITKLAAKAGTATATLSAAINGEKISGEKAAAISSAMGLRTEAVFSLERDTTPLSSKTILEHHRIISSVLAQAEKEMLIQFNPASKATPPKVQRKAPDYYQPETISQILDALDNAPLKWRAATYLLIDTGCRRGEAMGLKWESLDLAGGIMTIERALLYSPKKGVYESTPKTGKSRVLKLAPETLQILGKWKTAQEELRNGYADAWIDTGYVFTQDNGDRMNPDSLTDWLNKFSKANALPHIHPHAFRHTAASTMIANGVDIVTAANELGHASATTTATIYAHQIAEAKARAEDVRAGVFKRQ